MNPMIFDPIILTLIIAAPLAGAILLALIPERENTEQPGSKRHAIGALLITLFTLLLTLHLPAHFNYHAAPHTTGQAYSAAQDALKNQEELTFSDAEIDAFLPGPLKRAGPRSPPDA